LINHIQLVIIYKKVNYTLNSHGRRVFQYPATENLYTCEVNSQRGQKSTQAVDVKTKFPMPSTSTKRRATHTPASQWSEQNNRNRKFGASTRSKCKFLGEIPQKAAGRSRNALTWWAVFHVLGSRGHY
jgi:hypothetical protein